MKTKTVVYINGRLVPGDKATVSVFDRGLNYGDGVFETIRSYDGAPAFIKEHLARLKKGIMFLGIRPGYLKTFNNDIKNGVIARLLHANGASNGSGYVKIIVTGGVVVSTHAPDRAVPPTVVITARPLDTRAVASMQGKGVSAILIKGNPPVFAGIKTLNYLPNVLARGEAVRQKAMEGIFTLQDGTILEGTSSNVFIVSKGVIKTPATGSGQSGILPGITRQMVMKLSGGAGIEVKETAVKERELLDSYEAFLTNSVMEVVPLVKVGGQTIGAGVPGPVTRFLQLAYRAAAAR